MTHTTEQSGPTDQSEVPECHGDTCITCSDVAVAVRVVELRADDLALVDTGQGREEVSVAFVSAQVGDMILVHAKEAIAIQSSASSEGESPARPGD
ncbi:MAG: HypC/HybG/HupF family hydrogenase formation chaperone [Sciscionella sp.]